MKKVLSPKQLEALAKGREARHKKSKSVGNDSAYAQAHVPQPVPMKTEIRTEGRAQEPKAKAEAPIQGKRRGRPPGVKNKPPSERVKKRRLTKAELHTIRVAAGKKAAQTRKERKSRRSETIAVHEALKKLQPLKLEYSKFSPIMDEEPEVIEKPEVIEVKSEKYNYYDANAIAFAEENDEINKQILECLKELTNKKLKAGGVNIVAKCFNTVHEGYKRISDIYNKIPKHFNELSKAEKPTRDEAILSIIELSSQLDKFTKLLLNNYKYTQRSY